MATLTWEDVGIDPATPATPTPMTPRVTWEDVGVDKPKLEPKTNDASSSLSYTAGVLLGMNPPVSDADKIAANVRSGVHRIPGAVVGIPHALSSVADIVMGSTEPSAVTKFLPSEQKVTSALHELDSRWNPSWMGAPSEQYQPETTQGRVLQDVIAGAPAALIGGGGLLGAAAREVANAGGATAGNLAQDANWTPQGQLAAGLLGGLAGGYVPRAGQAVWNNAQRAYGAPKIAAKTANARIVNAADMEKDPMLTALADYNDPTVPNIPNQTTRQVLNDPGLKYYEPMGKIKPTANGTAGWSNFFGSTGILGGLGLAANQGAKALGFGIDPFTATAMGAAGGLLNFGKNRYQDFQRQVGGIARRAMDDPVYAEKLLRDYNGTNAQFPMSHQWRQYPGLLPALSTDNLYE